MPFKKTTLLALMVLALCGCAGETVPPTAAANSAELFLPDAEFAKVFFTTTYDILDADFTFDESFRWRVDDAYYGDINTKQFIQTKVPTGTYALNVDELGWGGFKQSTAKLKLLLRAGEVYFIEDHVISDKKSVLKVTPIPQGRKDVLSRARMCPCDPPLSTLF